MLETLQKNWWLIAVRGVLAIVFGVLALASPYIVIFSLITFFAFFAILSGFFILTLAFLGETDNKGLRIIEGLIFLGAGIVVLLNPVSALGGIMIFIAAWAILSGLIHIIGAIKMRKVITNEWLMILNGVISIIFGILLAGNLIQGAGVMLMVFGAFAILSGIFSIMLAFRIRTYKLN
ncbi:MAG: HdeD family acid-resistance protein [Ignavibacteria bacterium]|nr:HdeD family acid-resistance protein [Ignavibacteria bacterium]